MIRRPARTRRWMLLAAPWMALCGLRWRAGGAVAALAVWLALGLTLPPAAYPYPRKRKPAFHRLFLGFSVCVFILEAEYSAMGLFLPSQKGFHSSDILFLIGSIGFALPIGQKACRFPMKRKSAWLAAGFLIIVSVFIFLSGTHLPSPQETMH